MHNPSLVLFVLVPLIAWRMYRRVRRLIGRQPSIARRHWTASVLFPLVVLLLAMAGLAGPAPETSVGALAGGVLAGVALGIVGLRMTRFEVTEQGLFYTPNAHIGVGLSVLLICRVAWRIFQGFEGSFAPESADALGSSPLTLLVFGMLAGYYATYAIGLLRWRRSVGA
jgi:cytochrome b561